MLLPLPLNLADMLPSTEANNRAAFIDFCQGLLSLNPLERWTPQQAKQHPFITGEKFTRPFNVRFFLPFLDLGRPFTPGSFSQVGSRHQRLLVGHRPPRPLPPIPSDHMGVYCPLSQREIVPIRMRRRTTSNLLNIRCIPHKPRPRRRPRLRRCATPMSPRTRRGTAIRTSTMVRSISSPNTRNPRPVLEV